MRLTRALHPNPFEANGMPPTYETMHKPEQKESDIRHRCSRLRNQADEHDETKRVEKTGEKSIACASCGDKKLSWF